tara:strand:- start:4883 stop:5191 length:309 start_codon:yes stop_codon:yes gene_type:complete
MSNNRGVFTPIQVQQHIKENKWVPLEHVWISPSPFMSSPPDTGYFGGRTPGSKSTMDKVTYASDTTAAVPGANLTAARKYPAASSARANGLPTTFSSSLVYV